MLGHVNDPIQTDGLHVPALARQALMQNHTVSELEVVVHVLGVEAEQAADVIANSEDSSRSVPDKTSDIAAANTDPAAGIKVKPAKTRLPALPQSRSCQTASHKQQKYPITQSRSPCFLF